MLITFLVVLKKIPDKIGLRKEGMTPEAWGGWSYFTHSPEAERDESLLFLQLGTTAVSGTASIYGCLPSSVKPFETPVIEIPRDTSPWLNPFKVIVQITNENWLIFSQHSMKSLAHLCPVILYMHIVQRHRGPSASHPPTSDFVFWMLKKVFTFFNLGIS